MNDFNDVDQINDTQRLPRENHLTGADAPSASADSPPRAAGQTAAAPTPGGADSPPAPPPETWQQRALKMLLADNTSRHNTRFQMLSAAEVLAIEAILAD